LDAQVGSLQLQRQAALRPTFMLQPRRRVLRLREDLAVAGAMVTEAAALAAEQVVNHRDVQVTLRLDLEMGGVSAPPEFDEATRATLLEELRDWYLPHSLTLSLVRLSPVEGGQLAFDAKVVVRPGAAAGDMAAGKPLRRLEDLDAIRTLLSTFADAEGNRRVEMDRLPQTTKALGALYMGIEVLDVQMPQTVVTQQVCLADRLRAAEAEVDERAAEVARLRSAHGWAGTRRRDCSRQSQG